MFSGSSQPQRAVADTDEAFPIALGTPRRAVTRSRLTRGGIGVAAALLAGGIAMGVPALAHGAGTVPAGTPVLTADSGRAGTTDAFVARGESLSSSREAADDLKAAADARAAQLATVDEQVVAIQTEAAAEARQLALSSMTNAIDSESERLSAIKFFWPTEGSITSPWGPRMHPILHYVRLHGGADIGGAIGAPIYAVADGVVTKAATGHNGGSGNNVRIDHGMIDGEALETGYLHMSSIDVAEGQKVTKGQRIGAVGNTGLSTAPHLHFSVYANGVNSDPAPYLNQGR
ncbi:MAG: M23 family metallopeptidase [Propioniciclava sp.]|uniref:M23 family metallopeptidase n=1 Tax=Propioniciclava sp. TaxID=2038686 RepID=UPI0039E4A465